MVWTDLEMERVVSDEQLQHAFSAVFGVSPTEVAVTEDLFTVSDSVREAILADDHLGEAPIYLERSRTPGDFPFHVMVVLRKAELEAMVKGWDREVAMIQRLADELGVRMLISDDDVNPYTWILVTPHAAMTPVRVDADQLDDHDALVLAEPAASEHKGRPRKIVAAR